MRPALSLRSRNARILSLLLTWTVLVSTQTGCNWLSGRTSNRVGQAYYRFGNYTAAAHAFRRASIDDPTNADYLHNLASARRKQGHVAESEYYYRQALQRDPGHQPSYHGLAQVLKQQNRDAEALAMLQTWTQVEPYRSEPYVELAWLQRSMGDTSGAQTTLQNALAKNPGNATVLAHLGQTYQDTGQHDTALAMYQRSLHSNWYQPQVHSRISSLQDQRRIVTARAGYSGYYGAPVSLADGTVIMPQQVPVVAAGPFNADPAHVPERTALGASATGNKTDGTGKQ